MDEPAAFASYVESAPPALLTPVTEQERIVSLDVLRGFALLGILILNIQAFSMIGAAYMNPNAYGDFSGSNAWVWRLSHVFGDQKFWGIFSMLFGAGIVLMTSRAEARGRSSAGLHYRRMGWLILFGLLHAHLLWYGDILYFYGMCGLLLYLFRKLPWPALVAIGIVCLVIASGLNVANGLTMEFWGEEGVQNFSDETWLPTAEVVESELAAYRAGWLGQMPTRSLTAIFMETFIFTFGGIGLKTAGIMCIGMALFKLGVLSAERSIRFYLILGLIGFGVGLPVIEFGVRQHFAHGWDVRYSFFLGSQYNFWASILVSLGYVSMIMIIVKLGVLKFAQFVLASVGRMALTNYLVQTIICTTIFYGHGFGQFGHFERTDQMIVVASVWAFQLALSPIWLHYFKSGPFEWLWRSLSYGRVQPFRR